MPRKIYCLEDMPTIEEDELNDELLNDGDEPLFEYAEDKELIVCNVLYYDKRCGQLASRKVNMCENHIKTCPATLQARMLIYQSNSVRWFLN